MSGHAQPRSRSGVAVVMYCVFTWHGPFSAAGKYQGLETCSAMKPEPTTGRGGGGGGGGGGRGLTN